MEKTTSGEKLSIYILKEKISDYFNTRERGSCFFFLLLMWTKHVSLDATDTMREKSENEKKKEKRDEFFFKFVFFIPMNKYAQGQQHVYRISSQE